MLDQYDIRVTTVYLSQVSPDILLLLSLNGKMNSQVVAVHQLPWAHEFSPRCAN